ncbi:MAG: hypothetical protein EU548_01045 [Promethearchaeota archaeon]|nr:MAG: hypothetical protein EU548_01045 [Candidatus Lokiarchaeota archaeon]
MDFHYNLESFNTTPIVKKYEGKSLDNLFPDHKILSNSMGQCMEIKKEEDISLFQLNPDLSKKRLIKNLKVVYSIGEVYERELFKKGVRNIYDLRFNLRFRDHAKEILDLIHRKDYITLCTNRYIYDIDTSFCFKKEDLLFIDIETLGLYDSPIIIIGIGFYTSDHFVISQYFTRDLEEEISMLEHFKEKVFPKFKCFVSYNGKSFDIPYLANRFLYFFDENPMISEEDIPYDTTNTKFHHIDLYHNCRRRYKGKFEKYTLTMMEEKLLNWNRGNELPSHLVGACYKKYSDNPKRYIGLIKECIDHNYYDIYSMPLILRNLLEY